MINLNQIKIEDFIKKSDNLLIIAIVALGLVFTVKINAKNVSLANNLTQKIKTQKKSSTLFSKINALASDYQDYKKNIFFQKDSAQVVNLINEWARNFGVEITSIRPQYTKESGNFLYIPIELEAKCDYSALGQFLSRLENYDGFIDIVNLRINPDRFARREVNPAPDRLNINLTLNAMVLKELDISEAISKKR